MKEKPNLGDMQTFSSGLYLIDGGGIIESEFTAEYIGFLERFGDEFLVFKVVTPEQYKDRVVEFLLPDEN